MNVRVVEDPETVGAVALAEGIQASVDERGRCVLGLSRGTTLFRKLAAARLQWDAVEVVQVDERIAPEGAAERNLTAIERELLSNIEGRRPRLHAMPVTGDLEAAVDTYAAELKRVAGLPPVLDIVHLGIGSDGHTASLVPGDPVLSVTDSWVAVTRLYQGFRRMTLTFPVLDAARRLVLVASGEAKADAVRALRAGDRSIPAARVDTSQMTLVVDPAASGEAENRL